jgi:5'-deoxynucleotidase
MELLMKEENSSAKSSFFAMMARMKYIERWALMRNSIKENISEHSMEVAMLSHALAIIGNRRLGQNYDQEHIAMLGLYHDCTEIITGDMPTPTKYENDEIQTAYKQIEKGAAFRLLNLLPNDLREDYEQILWKKPGQEEDWLLVKAADKLSALIKCIEETKVGNQEFASARRSLTKAVHQLHCPEAEIFCQDFLPAYEKTIDEISKG